MTIDAVLHGLAWATLVVFAAGLLWLGWVVNDDDRTNRVAAWIRWRRSS